MAVTTPDSSEKPTHSWTIWTAELLVSFQLKIRRHSTRRTVQINNQQWRSYVKSAEHSVYNWTWNPTA